MLEASDSLHDPKDPAPPVATTSEVSLPNGPGWEGPTYYGRSQLKAAPFNKWVVGGYIFLAGLSGGSALLSTIADAVGGPAAKSTIRRGRYLSMIAPTLGSGLLIFDLHTPQRFYNMFRIAKSTSPMSIGTWILMSFSGAAGLGAVAQFLSDRLPGLGWLRKAASVAGAPAAVSGAGLSTYTASLLSATSTPYWAASPRALAVRFGASSIASAAAALTLGEGSRSTRRSLETIGAAALTIELIASLKLHGDVRRKGVGETLKGNWGEIDHVGVTGLGVLVPLGLYAASRLSGRSSASTARLAAVATLAGGAMLRIATLGIGDRSASRPEISFRFSQPENLPNRQLARRAMARLPSKPDRAGIS